MFPNELKNIQIQILQVPKQDLVRGVKIVYTAEVMVSCYHEPYNTVYANSSDTFDEANKWVNLTLKKINLERRLDK
jgi:hypothetical protein